MVCGDFKDLARRTASDKILCDKAFNIAKNTKDDGYRPGLASMIYKFLIKKHLLHVQINLLVVVSNKELAEGLRKPIIKKFNKREAYSSFIDNIWGLGC